MQANVLVTGATGTQGSAVVDALLDRSVPVRALVRDTNSSGAAALARKGVEVVQGDMDDPTSLDRAMAGVDGVFSVQMPPAPNDSELEVRQGRNLVEAALRAGVRTFVHTSVARAGGHESFTGWAEQRWWPKYWTSKDDVNAIVRNAGFPHWVILKPAYMMDNFFPPKCNWMYPGLVPRGVIESVMDEDARLDLVAASDVGAFAAAAFVEPCRLHGEEIDMAGDSLTMREVAKILTDVTGKPVAARQVSMEEALELGHHAGLSESQQWASIEGYKVDIPLAASHGLPLTSFAEWAEQMKDRFVIGQPSSPDQA